MKPQRLNLKDHNLFQFTIILNGFVRKHNLIVAAVFSIFCFELSAANLLSLYCCNVSFINLDDFSAFIFLLCFFLTGKYFYFFFVSNRSGFTLTM